MFKEMLKKMGLSMVRVAKKIGFLTLCIAYTLYWIAIMTRFNLGTMESYVIWTLLWLGFGVLSALVFDRGHEIAMKHLKAEGIRYNNNNGHRYLPAYVCVGGLVGYYIAFKYFDSRGILWGAMMPASYFIFMEVASRFVRASKLTRREDGSVVARRG